MSPTKLWCCAVAVVLIAASAARAEVVFVNWDKPRGGDRGNVAAFDLDARKLLWETHVCEAANFAAKTSAGALVGCDDTRVVLLDAKTGEKIWEVDVAGPDQARLKNHLEINQFHAETDAGFLVSHGDQMYFLVGRAGEYLMRCDNTCVANPRVLRSRGEDSN